MKLELLIKLIHSLNDKEKVYCQEYLIEAKYIALIDFLSVPVPTSIVSFQAELASKGYDELDFAYLEEQILSILNNENTSPLHDVNKFIQKANWLFNHQQYERCLYYTQKAKEIARIHEYFEKLVTICAIEINLIKCGYLEDNVYPKDDAIVYNKLAINRRKYIGFQYELELQRTFVEGHNLKKMSKIMDHELMLDSEQALSISAKLLFYSSKAKVSFLLEDYKMAYEMIVQYLALYDKNSYLLNSPVNLSKYISAVGNYLSLSRVLERAEDVVEKMKDLKSLVEQQEDSNQTRLLLRIYSIAHIEQIRTFMEQGALQEIDALIPLVEELLDNDIMLSYRCDFYHYFALTYYYMGNFENALKWIELIFKQEELSCKKDILSIVYQLKIVIYYESRFNSRLNKLLQETKQFIKQQKRRSPFEVLFVNCFEDLLALGQEKGEMILKNNYRIFQATLKDSPIKHKEHYFDIITWIEKQLDSHFEGL